MSTSQLRARIAALRAEAAAIGTELAQGGSAMERDELFEISGELQGASNAVEGAQLVAMAHAAAHESRLTGSGFVEVHHDVGFVDTMAPSLVSLEAGIGEWAAGRRVSLAAKTSQRFPRLLGKVVAGELTTATVAKVVSVCDGLDLQACARVEDGLIDRLPGLDPARVTGVIRTVATRVAADQMRQATKKNRTDRYVQVNAGPDGTTLWCAQLPTGPSAAMWDSIKRHGDTLAKENPVAHPGPGPRRRPGRPRPGQRHRHRQGHPRHPGHHRHRRREGQGRGRRRRRGRWPHHRCRVCWARPQLLRPRRPQRR